jgi:predicted DCC family thiol-disulfide oxidoreductase YuxK
MIDKSQFLLFDGDCNLCNFMTTFIIKHDQKGKFYFATLQSVIGQSTLQKIGLPVSDFGSFVYIKDDKYFVKSTAALNVLRDLGGFWKLAYFFKIIPKPLRDVVYNLLAKNRYKIFGKSSICNISPVNLKHKFIE